MKTKEELNALKEEVETLNKKLAELTDEELAQVAGGSVEMEIRVCEECGTEFERDPYLMRLYPELCPVCSRKRRRSW